jgi:hypothetical protein
MAVHGSRIRASGGQTFNTHSQPTRRADDESTTTRSWSGLKYKSRLPFIYDFVRESPGYGMRGLFDEAINFIIRTNKCGQVSPSKASWVGFREKTMFFTSKLQFFSDDRNSVRISN